MNKSVRKQISLSPIDLQEIEKIKGKNVEVKTNSEVVKFLLHYYLQNEEQKIKSEEKILSKLNHIDYELQLVHLLFKYITPDIFGEKDSTHRFIKVERDLKKRLRDLE